MIRLLFSALVESRKEKSNNILVLFIKKRKTTIDIMSQPSTPALQSTYLKVFIQRDYSDGTSVKFQTRFPPELEGRVSFYLLLNIVLCYSIHNP